MMSIGLPCDVKTVLVDRIIDELTGLHTGYRVQAITEEGREVCVRVNTQSQATTLARQLLNASLH